MCFKTSNEIEILMTFFFLHTEISTLLNKWERYKKKMKSVNFNKLNLYYIKNIFKLFYLVFVVLLSPKDGNSHRVFTALLNCFIFHNMLTSIIRTLYSIFENSYIINVELLLSVKTSIIFAIGIRTILIKKW